MKKMTAIILALTFAVSLLAPASAIALNTNRTPGGVPAFFIGCCFGPRVGTEWNEGADLHWREWTPIIPYVGIVFSVWNGIDCSNGMTAHEFAERNGANWY